jgi:hypothetical protein
LLANLALNFRQYRLAGFCAGLFQFGGPLLQSSPAKVIPEYLQGLLPGNYGVRFHDVLRLRSAQRWPSGVRESGAFHLPGKTCSRKRLHQLGVAFYKILFGLGKARTFVTATWVRQRWQAVIGPNR